MPKRRVDLGVNTNTLEWKPRPTPGAWEKILNFDEETGNLVRLMKVEPGHENEGPIVHDYWEEKYILEGDQMDMSQKKTLSVGTYSCIPPGTRHGPYKYPKGSVWLEFRQRK